MGIDLQMKTSFAIAMLAASTTAFDVEFMRGCQQGIFIMNDKQIDSYDCAPVEISKDIDPFIKMAKPAIQMAKSMNPDAPVAILNMAETVVDESALIYSVFYGYEGTQFCSGLIFSHELAKLFLKAGKKEIGKYFPFLENTDFINN